MGGLREDFAALAAAGERTDLARAALAIARIAYPDLDPAPYLRQLDDLAAAVRPRLYPQASPEAAVTELGSDGMLVLRAIFELTPLLLRPFLLGVTAGVIGLIAAVTVQIVETSIVDVYTAILAIGAFLVLNRWHSKLTGDSATWGGRTTCDGRVFNFASANSSTEGS